MITLVYQRGRKKYRPDLGEVFDSMGEANVARVLQLLGIKYERGHRININEIARKYGFCRTETDRYLQEIRPDFCIVKLGRLTDIHIEVKPAGMTFNDRMRIAAALLKPERIKLELIMPVTYKILEKAFKHKIPEWEG